MSLPVGPAPGWLLPGLVGGGAVALTALRLGWLTPGGAAAAAPLAAVVAAGAGLWGAALLLAFFASASALGRLNPRREGPRRASQVLANGGVAGLLAAARWLGHGPEGAGAGGTGLLLGLAGSLAAMAADTWASEVGMASRWPARLLPSGRRAAPGETGAVSLPGTLAGAGGAALIGLLAAAGPVGPRAAVWVAVTVGGFAGMWADSLLGATLERRGRLGNDGVNLLASGAGAGAAAALFVGLGG